MPVDRSIDQVIPDSLGNTSNLGDLEAQRQANESTRIAQETGRVNAETLRVTTFTQRLAQWQAQVDQVVTAGTPGEATVVGAALLNAPNQFTAFNDFIAGLRTGQSLPANLADNTVVSAAWVRDRLQSYVNASALTAYAPLASPALTGTPTAPTAAEASNGTQIANTAWVKQALSAATGTNLTSYLLKTEAAGLYAPINNAALTGNPTAPTQTSTDNSTRIATTAFVQTVVAAAGGGGTQTSTFTNQITAQAGLIAMASDVLIRASGGVGVKNGLILQDANGVEFGSLRMNLTDGTFEIRRGDSAGVAQLFFGATTMTISGQTRLRATGPASEFQASPTITNAPLATAQDTQVPTTAWVRQAITDYAPAGTGTGITRQQVADMFTHTAHTNMSFSYDSALLRIVGTATASSSGSGVTRVVPAPVADATTNANNIQNTINASSSGDTIEFARGVYNINRPIIGAGGRQYRGQGHAYATTGDGGSTVIRQANSANIANSTVGFTGLLVFSNWNRNSTVAEVDRVSQNVNGPVRITNLHFDGNRLNNPTSNACGLVLWNFWSIVDYCGFYNCPVDGARSTDTDSAGLAMANSASENQFLFCRFNRNSQAHYRQHQGLSGTNNWNLDGRLFYCYMDGSDGQYSIHLDRAAGWYVEGNHLYGIARSAILVNNAFATTVTNNYVEPFGGASTTTTDTFAGLKSDVLGGRGLIASNNIFGTNANSATGNYRCMDIQGNATNAMFVGVGNQFYAGGNTSRVIGLRLTLGGGTGYAGRFVSLNTSFGPGTKNSISAGWTRETD